MRPDGTPIPRLYSAGELGSIYSYLYQGTGNIGECLAFGRIPGGMPRRRRRGSDVSEVAIPRLSRALQRLGKLIKLAQNQRTNGGPANETQKILQGAAAAAVLLPTPFAIAQSARARTLRFVPQANLTLLDPIFTTALVTVNHGWAIYDMLFGVNRQYDVKPQMAEGYSVSDDGRTYLIRLREGLKFHNGEPVRAQDCAPSLKRWAARETFGQTVAKVVDDLGRAGRPHHPGSR